MCRVYLYTILSVLSCGVLGTIFVSQFFDTHFMSIPLGNPGDYSVLQLIALFYNIMMILFILRIKSHGTFYADNSSDCFPCLTASCGLLAAFWALVLAISMVNAREIFIQTGLFFLICLIQTIVLLMSSCWKQIEYDNMVREIIVETDAKKRFKGANEQSVSYDIGPQASTKNLEDKSTKTDNAILNVVELNNQESDEFLKIQKWATLLSKAQPSEIDSVLQDIKDHYSNDQPPHKAENKKSVSIEMSPQTQKSYELMLDRASLASSSSTSSLLSLLPDNLLTKY